MKKNHVLFVLLFERILLLCIFSAEQMANCENLNGRPMGGPPPKPPPLPPPKGMPMATPAKPNPPFFTPAGKLDLLSAGLASSFASVSASSFSVAAVFPAFPPPGGARPARPLASLPRPPALWPPLPPPRPPPLPVVGLKNCEGEGARPPAGLRGLFILRSAENRFVTM